MSLNSYLSVTEFSFSFRFHLLVRPEPCLSLTWTCLEMLQIGIRFTQNTLQTSEVSGRWLSLTFEIIDRWIREEAGERVYHVKVCNLVLDAVLVLSKILQIMFGIYVCEFAEI